MLAIPDHLHHEACQQLPDTQRSQLGQYMTSAAIARFMASLFHYPEQARLLDAGAGTGSLTAAFLDASLQHGTSTAVDAWEIDPTLRRYLQTTLEQYVQRGQGRVTTQLHSVDFIEDTSFAAQTGIGICCTRHPAAGNRRRIGSHYPALVLQRQLLSPVP